jgi:hypothetical protein
MAARLIVDPSTISFRASGPATAEIALELGSDLFPAAGWNDFVLVVLEAWMSALARLLRGVSGIERVHFMEGPYVVTLTRPARETIGLLAVQRPRTEYSEASVAALPFVQSVTTAARLVLKTCRDVGHHSIDLDRLDASLGALLEEQSKLEN